MSLTIKRDKSKHIQNWPEIVQHLCDHIENGGTLTGFCKQIGIQNSNLYRYLDTHAECAQKIANSKNRACETFVDECINIADDCDERNDAIQKSKLRIWTRTKLVAMWNPERWSEKIQRAEQNQNITVRLASDKIKINEIQYSDD